MEREIRTILVIDSSASILFYHGMLLRRLEYNVVTARNAEDALRIMEQSVPSIVLTDISLPAMSGINLMKRMKDAPLWKTIPIVILTSEIDPGLKDTCMRLGCAAYLSKPAEPDVLYRTLQTVSESIPRANIRLSTSLKVIVGDGTVAGGAARTEYATAISEGGLYVRTLYPQPQNALTPVRIFIGDREIPAKTVVLYSFTMGGGPFKEPGMGLKFVEIPDADRNFIRSFIKQQLTQDISPKENNETVPVR
jgi:CheY-like chemotaxis protein